MPRPGQGGEWSLAGLALCGGTSEDELPTFPHHDGVTGS